MKDRLRRITTDLKNTLDAMADVPDGEHVLVAPAKPRVPPAEEDLQRLAAEIRTCRRCELCRTRTNAVPGHGASDARVMFVGEAPGADEDRQGLPFVGRAGDILTKMLAGINVRREDVFIGNVLKCRPPGNRDPRPDEVVQCRPYLDSQIAAIRPHFIVSLGRIAAHLLLDTSRGIMSLRGTPRPFRYPGGTAVLLPMLHPAYLLRNENAKREAWEDLKLLHRLLREKTGDWPPPLTAR